ncbi:MULTISPECIES: hypothetical protein [Enterococcus]|uniref:Uncharacterized protein n=2 Tax=Enterococcus TaxID=1350 RepID=A0A179EUI6_ENTTH|nr:MULTISPECIES: hypothetical protein [Enterococcus]ASZ07710.1 hypothetical protein CK496_07235 [Enterococcus thailandicus]MBO0431421.1 hypothetical protein [Enterococcus sp. DIV0660C]MBO0482374.1 hypothetical protein [Enterococcus sp. MSG2901]MDA3965646.1 hypothetical protein [Enterococcus thailandicus]MDA3972456.1 hypothetical protein [Enterococcus thailandicus]
MKSIRRIGLVLLVLFLGILIGNFGIQPALIIFLPLFTLWFMLWDEKKYRQAEQRRLHEEHFYHEHYLRSRQS